MNARNTWTVILLLAAALLAVRACTGPGMGKVYVEQTSVAFVEVTEGDVTTFTAATPGTADAIEWTAESSVPPNAFAAASEANPDQSIIHLSWNRTIGVWVAALLTLAIFSFLYRDNPFYKLAESIIVGVSAAYWMVVGFWDTLMPKLFGKLIPTVVAANFLPSIEQVPNYWVIVPALLGVLLLCRLNRNLASVSVIPLAFIVGTTAGLKFVSYVESDLLAQAQSTLKPLWQGDVGGTIKQTLLFVGVISALVYFFFSVEHKGVVGGTARVGIWYLMITFGAAFGFTVMGRIALFAARCEFLFDDWLWLIDPTDRRSLLSAVGSATGLLG